MKSAGGSQTLTIGNICVEEHAAAHFDLSRALFITELALPLAFAARALGGCPQNVAVHAHFAARRCPRVSLNHNLHKLGAYTLIIW